MFGASYYGYTQWAAAMERPPHLRAIAPAITWSDYGDGGAFRGGALELGKLLHWNLLMSIDVVKRRMSAAGRPPAEIGQAVRRIADAVDRLSEAGFDELPLVRLESLRELGMAEMLAGFLAAGPAGQPAAYSVRHAEVEVPSLNIGGWYDIFIQGTIDNFAGMRAHGRGDGRHAHLLVGPWSHLNRGSAVGDVEFGLAASAAMIDLVADLTTVQLRWFDRWLKGADNGVDREPPVRLFVMGENRWRSFPGWPLADVRAERWFLQPGGGLAADPPAMAAAPSRYRYDPANPVPTLGGQLLLPGKYGSGARDQAPLSARADVLTYSGPPLREPLAIGGQVSATLWATSSAPDTDFVVRLLDVHPDGFMQNLCDGIVRARYRRSLAEPAWLTPGEPDRFHVDLWSVAHVFRPGHRVAVQVTSSSFPRWDRNLNTADAPGAGASGRPAEQAVLHAPPRASFIELPVL